ncbi:MAG: UbiD family decarboxylase [Candidatus Tectomicrobia bacterium]|uniref:UbiD family decarboxylase n=1 Tax=Tectimicrobiota bacterium TaxID=2528274 RepID=A0A932GNA9_UNCTE|nr:UbiD family decarboxylase [Candidatus Tectomicrobia bacterium]
MTTYYRDLREYLEVLKKNGKLVTIERPMNKDTEMHPLVRLQFRGLPEKDRKAFLFTHVTDSTGKRYDVPVVVGCMAASREIYAHGMNCELDEVPARWHQALVHPIPPVLVDKGPIQEVILKGSDLDAASGISFIPVPISTPGFDNAPYLTAAHWITKDPVTGIRNVGNYRGMVKSPTRLGCFPGAKTQGVAIHWRQCKEMGKPLEAAIALGVTPNISYCAVTRIPHGRDELEVAGGIAGSPVELVKCQTVDLEVPAHSEIVIEGIIPTDSGEIEGPFGEFTGFMGPRGVSLYFNVTCITMRSAPIYQAFLSQFPPSESSKIRQMGREHVLKKTLSVDCEIPGVLDVALLEPTGTYGFVVVRVSRRSPEEGERLKKAVKSIMKTWPAKTFVLVDEDIDPRDADSVNWAMSFRMQPHRDMEIFASESPTTLDCSISPHTDMRTESALGKETMASVLLIDARAKWDYPPVSLPKKEFMERALQIWNEEGLPALNNLKAPWFGYSMGYWTEEDAQEADLAVQSRYFETGKKFEARREKL